MLQVGPREVVTELIFRFQGVFKTEIKQSRLANQELVQHDHEKISSLATIFVVENQCFDLSRFHNTCCIWKSSEHPKC